MGVRLIVVCALLAPLLASADLTITTQYGNDVEMGRSARTVRYSGARMRMEWQNRQKWPSTPKILSSWTYGPHMAAVYQCDLHRALEIDLDGREYVSRDVDGEPARYRPHLLPSKPSGATVSITVETRDTGERKQILGHLARHIITNRRQVASPGACVQSDDSVSDGWYIDLETPSWACSLIPKMPYGQMFAVVSTGNCHDRYEIHQMAPLENGFPLQTTTTSKGRYTFADGTSKEYTYTNIMEVTDLSDAPLDPALFEVPAGFKKVSHLSSEPPMPLHWRVALAWDNFVRSVSSVFR